MVQYSVSEIQDMVQYSVSEIQDMVQYSISEIQDMFQDSVSSRDWTLRVPNDSTYTCKINIFVLIIS